MFTFSHYYSTISDSHKQYCKSLYKVNCSLPYSRNSIGYLTTPLYCIPLPTAMFMKFPRRLIYMIENRIALITLVFLSITKGKTNGAALGCNTSFIQKQNLNLLYRTITSSLISDLKCPIIKIKIKYKEILFVTS